MKTMIAKDKPNGPREVFAARLSPVAKALIRLERLPGESDGDYIQRLIFENVKTDAGRRLLAQSVRKDPMMLAALKAAELGFRQTPDPTKHNDIGNDTAEGTLSFSGSDLLDSTTDSEAANGMAAPNESGMKPAKDDGRIAQLIERVVGNDEVEGLTPSSSTTSTQKEADGIGSLAGTGASAQVQRVDGEPKADVGGHRHRPFCVVKKSGTCTKSGHNGQHKQIDKGKEDGGPGCCVPA